MQDGFRLAYAPEEAGKHLGISRAAVYRLMADGSLPSVKIGRSRRVRHEAIVEFLDRLETGSPAA